MTSPNPDFDPSVCPIADLDVTIPEVVYVLGISVAGEMSCITQPVPDFNDEQFLLAFTHLDSANASLRRHRLSPSYTAHPVTFNDALDFAKGCHQKRLAGLYNPTTGRAVFCRATNE